MIKKKAESQIYQIHIDGQWSFLDFASFPRTYIQAYSLAYLLSENSQKAIWAFRAFPWRGGYSAVNFYNAIYRQLPAKHRPQVRRIQYASPGIIELSLLAAAALSLKTIVSHVLAAARDISTTYTQIYRELQERKLLRIKTESARRSLEKENIEFINWATKEMARFMGIRSLNELNRLTGSPLVSLKILLSFYRRVRDLGRFSERKGIEY